MPLQIVSKQDAPSHEDGSARGKVTFERMRDLYRAIVLSIGFASHVSCSTILKAIRESGFGDLEGLAESSPSLLGRLHVHEGGFLSFDHQEGRVWANVHRVPSYDDDSTRAVMCPNGDAHDAEIAMSGGVSRRFAKIVGSSDSFFDEDLSAEGVAGSGEQLLGEHSGEEKTSDLSTAGAGEGDRGSEGQACVQPVASSRKEPGKDSSGGGKAQGDAGLKEAQGDASLAESRTRLVGGALTGVPFSGYVDTKGRPYKLLDNDQVAEVLNAFVNKATMDGRPSGYLEKGLQKATFESICRLGDRGVSMLIATMNEQREEVVSLLNWSWEEACRAQACVVDGKTISFPLLVVLSDGISVPRITIERGERNHQQPFAVQYVSYLNVESALKRGGEKSFHAFSHIEAWGNRMHDLCRLIDGHTQSFGPRFDLSKGLFRGGEKLEKAVYSSFARAVRNGQIWCSRGLQFAAFATSAEIEGNRPVYACFAASRHGRPWEFIGFSFEGTTTGDAAASALRDILADNPGLSSEGDLLADRILEQMGEDDRRSLYRTLVRHEGFFRNLPPEKVLDALKKIGFFWWDYGNPRFQDVMRALAIDKGGFVSIDMASFSSDYQTCSYSLHRIPEWDDEVTAECLCTTLDAGDALLARGGKAVVRFSGNGKPVDVEPIARAAKGVKAGNVEANEPTERAQAKTPKNVKASADAKALAGAHDAAENPQKPQRPQSSLGDKKPQGSQNALGDQKPKRPQSTPDAQKAKQPQKADEHKRDHAAQKASEEERNHGQKMPKANRPEGAQEPQKAKADKPKIGQEAQGAKDLKSISEAKVVQEADKSQRAKRDSAPRGSNAPDGLKDQRVGETTATKTTATKTVASKEATPKEPEPESPKTTKAVEAPKAVERPKAEEASKAAEVPKKAESAKPKRAKSSKKARFFVMELDEARAEMDAFKSHAKDLGMYKENVMSAWSGSSFDDVFSVVPGVYNDLKKRLACSAEDAQAMLESAWSLSCLDDAFLANGEYVTFLLPVKLFDGEKVPRATLTLKGNKKKPLVLLYVDAVTKRDVATTKKEPRKALLQFMRSENWLGRSSELRRLLGEEAWEKQRGQMDYSNTNSNQALIKDGGWVSACLCHDLIVALQHDEFLVSDTGAFAAFRTHLRTLEGANLYACLVESPTFQPWSLIGFCPEGTYVEGDTASEVLATVLRGSAAQSMISETKE